jgi:hypothetical protein
VGNVVVVALGGSRVPLRPFEAQKFFASNMCSLIGNCGKQNFLGPS